MAKGTPHSRAEGLPSRRFNALEFLSSLSKEFLELPTDSDLFPFVGRKLLAVIEQGMVMMACPTGNEPVFRIHWAQASGESETAQVGPDELGRPFEALNPFRPILLSGRLFRIWRTGSAALALPVKEIVPKLENRYGPLEMYALGFVWRDELLGAALVLVPVTGRIKNRAMMETLGRLASAAIRRGRTEVALRESEVKYRQLVKFAPSGIFEVDFQKGRFVSVNDIMCEYMGYTKDEFLGMSPSDILTEESQALFTERVRRMSAGETVPETVEFKIRAKHGREFWVILNVRFFWEEGAITRATVIVHNITEIKAAQEALRESEMRLRLLSSRLINAQEEERKRISRELHDELGQDLMVLKLQLKSLEGDKGRRDSDRERTLQQILKYINGIAENVRRLSRNLSPAILEDLGLVAAIRWLSEETSKLYQLDITTDVYDMDGLFAPEHETIIYRIIQEALTNVVKHARATQVHISARVEGKRCILLFQDDGIGFDVAAVKVEGVERRGFGLTTMQERARMLQGRLFLSSAEGKGTSIRLEIAL